MRSSRLSAPEIQTIGCLGATKPPDRAHVACAVHGLLDHTGDASPSRSGASSSFTGRWGKFGSVVISWKMLEMIDG